MHREIKLIKLARRPSCSADRRHTSPGGPRRSTWSRQERRSARTHISIRAPLLDHFSINTMAVSSVKEHAANNGIRTASVCDFDLHVSGNGPDQVLAAV